MTLRFFLGFAMVLLVNFVCVSVSAGNTASQDCRVTNLMVRMVPPGMENSAVYLQIENKSKVDHALIKAQSALAATVELHDHIKEGEIYKMRSVDRVHLKAGTRTEFRPGGLHIMLIDLKANLALGQKVSLTLTFEDGSEKSVEGFVTDISFKTMPKR